MNNRQKEQRIIAGRLKTDNVCSADILKEILGDDAK